MSKTDIKKGDEVVVIAGAEKGKRGKIVSYNRADERLTIEGLNLVKRHLKRTQDPHPSLQRDARLPLGRPSRQEAGQGRQEVILTKPPEN
jgi:ribosomal protein L24